MESVLIVGSGSIGQRHIGNLKKLGINNIVALRSMKGHYKKIPEDLNVTEVFSWEEALNQNSDIAIISNPALSNHSACEVAIYPSPHTL